MDKNKLWSEVYNDRIYPEREIKVHRNILSYDGVEIMGEGTMSCVCGQAKSRKTFLTSLFIDKVLEPDGLFTTDLKSPEIVVIDTEQNLRRIQQVSRRISKPEYVTFLSVIKYTIPERCWIVEQALKRLSPDILVIDGIKELTMDINSQEYSTKLTNGLLKWATEHHCHIMTILHTNPGSEKPSGALGTFMTTKSSSVIHVEKRGTTSRVKPLHMRDGDFKPFSFTITEDGVPVVK